MTDTPYAVFHLETASSTQDEARRRFRGAPLLVTAVRQTAGRGRQGRSWVTAPRAVAATLVFRPKWPEDSWPRLTLAAGLAACHALGASVRLEWPNDLVVGGCKVGGLLTEAGGGAVALGLGANLYWPEPAVERAGALHHRDPGPQAAEQAAEAWARDLLRRASRGPEAWGIDEYIPLCSTLGREVTWEPGGRGRAVAVLVDGGLEVAGAEGRLVLYAGEVHTIRAT